MNKWLNTTAIFDAVDGQIDFILYSTKIVSIRPFDPRKTIAINHGGYVTPTTARRINQIFQMLNILGVVFCKDGSMYHQCTDGKQRIPYECLASPTILDALYDSNGEFAKRFPATFKLLFNFVPRR